MRRCAVLLLLVTHPACGGRNLLPLDGGTVDAAVNDGGIDGDSGSPTVDCWWIGVDACPWRLPYCCQAFPVPEGWCTATPEEYLGQSTDEIEWQCMEKVHEDSLVPVDCIRLSEFRSDLCPASHPHCCSYDRGVEVCADHVLFGWRCDD